MSAGVAQPPVPFRAARAGEQTGLRPTAAKRRITRARMCSAGHPGFPWEGREHRITVRAQCASSVHQQSRGMYGSAASASAAQQARTQRQCLSRRAIGAASRRSATRTSASGSVAVRRRHRGEECFRKLSRVAEQANRPRAHGGLRMRERVESGRFIERVHLMQRPRGFQRGMFGRLAQRAQQGVDRRRVAPLAEQTHRR